MALLLRGVVCHTFFKFWDTYVNDLLHILLDHIEAKRDGIRDLELETFAEMLPNDCVYQHTHYARWGTLNVTDGRLLKQNKPEFHIEQVNHSVVYGIIRP